VDEAAKSRDDKVCEKFKQDLAGRRRVDDDGIQMGQGVLKLVRNFKPWYVGTLLGRQ